MTKAVKVTIMGQVQGVGFRFATQLEAKKNDLKGYVTNLPNGNVEIWLEGNEDKLATLLDWCYQGPPTADVQEVKLEEVDVKGYEHFNIEF